MNIRKTMTRALGRDTGEAPDALSLLRNDHREVDQLFQSALSDAMRGTQRRSTAANICDMLTLHGKMEESLFYPALRSGGGQEERETVLEAAEEHGMVKDMIAKIQGMRGRDETLEAKLTVLRELVQHHVREEETHIFDEARRTLGDERLRELGAEMLRFKERGGRGRTQRTGAKRNGSKRTTAAKRKR